MPLNSKSIVWRSESWVVAPGSFSSELEMCAFKSTGKQTSSRAKRRPTGLKLKERILFAFVNERRSSLRAATCAASAQTAVFADDPLLLCLPARRIPSHPVHLTAIPHKTKQIW